MQGSSSSWSMPERLRMGAVMSIPPDRSFGGLHSVISDAALETFCWTLEEALGVEVLPRGYPDYRALLESMTDGDADIAWLPPVVALRSASSGMTVPIAIPVRGGMAWFSSALFSRPNALIANPGDLVDARAAWVDPDSASGFLVMRAWLVSQGIDPTVAFKSERFLGSHEAVVDAVLRGEADVGSTYAHLDPSYQGVRAGGWGNVPVQIVALAGPIPADVIAASTRLMPQALGRIRATFTGSRDIRFLAACSQLFNAEGFAAADPAHITPLLGLLRHLEQPARGWHSVPPPPQKG